MHRGLRSLCLLLALAAPLGWPRPAVAGNPSREEPQSEAPAESGSPEAAEADEQTPAPGTERILEEITVTARKHEVPLEEAPKAVSALSGEEFEHLEVEKLDNMEARLPGLMVTRNDGAGRVVSIRGVGWETAQNLSTQPSVLVYLDGIYLANPLALGLALGDIERIEVHRGPQGTEFGQGTTGGAINVVTRRPDFNRAGGSVELSLGTYERTELAAIANAPVGDRFALRLSARKLDRAGFARIEGGPLDGYDLDDADVLLGHLAAEWIPSPDLVVRLGGFFHRSDQHGAAQKSLLDPNPDPRRLTQDYPSTFSLDNQSLWATIDWDLADGLRLASLTGFQRLEKNQSEDGDRLTEELVSVDLTGFGPANFDVLPFWDNDSKAVSQEIDLTAEGERTEWVLGLYYLHHANRNFFLEAAGPAPQSQFAEQLANPSPETLPPFEVPLEFVEDRTVTRDDAALFGQAVFELSDRVSLTAGGRLQRDESRDESTQFWFQESRQDLVDTAFTWKLGTDVRLADGHLLYGVVSTGWKNGGANPGAVVGGALDVPPTFRPEKVTAYELGSRNRLGRGSAHLDANLFYYDYDDYQYIQEDPVPFAAGTGNIPRVEIYGLETELAWQATPGLRLDAQVTALGGEILSDVQTLDVVDILESGIGRFTEGAVEKRAALRVGIGGNEPPKLPDLAGRLLLTHSGELPGGGELTTSFEYRYRGAYEYRIFNDPVADHVPAYSTIGLFLGYEPAESPFSFSLQATNLLDEAGVNSRFTNPFGLYTTSEELIPPRQLIATVRYRF